MEDVIADIHALECHVTFGNRVSCCLVHTQDVFNERGEGVYISAYIVCVLLVKVTWKFQVQIFIQF